MTTSAAGDHGNGAIRIGVIGGGFSGAAVIYHLAHRASRPLDIIAYEPRKRVGHGVAYSVLDEHLLLNVPAGKLSIDPDRPSDFLDWRVSRGLQADFSAFLPRSQFGAYVEARMTEQIQAARGMVTLRHVRNRIERINDEGDRLWVVGEGGESQRVDHAVLAVGHGPARVPDAIAPYTDAPEVLRSPWNRSGMARIAESADRVLLVGTGLTMCDGAIMLAQLGFKGEMTAISRRGLMPQAHGPSDPAALADWRDQLPAGSLRTLRRAVRQSCRANAWRSVIDTLRPRAGELWAALSPTEQARFIRRLAPYWDAHRHRLPPECANAIQLLRHTGALRVARGHIDRIIRHRSWLTCELLTYPGRHPETLHADAIVLCTGPEPDPRRWGSGLIDGLMDNGLASPETNGLGLRTTNSGMLIGCGEAVSRRLSTLGPPRRGSLWESTAVPEIAVQAAHLGRHLSEYRFKPGSDRYVSHSINSCSTPN